MPRQYLTSWKSRNTLTGVHFQLCLDGWYLWVIVLKFNFYSQFCIVHAYLRSKCKRLSPTERKPCCVFHLLGVYSMNSKDPRRQGFITYSAVGRSICTGTYSMGYSVNFHLTAKGCKIWWRNIIYVITFSAESAQLCICCHCIFNVVKATSLLVSCCAGACSPLTPPPTGCPARPWPRSLPSPPSSRRTYSGSSWPHRWGGGGTNRLGLEEFIWK